VSLSELGAAALTYAGGWGWPVYPLGDGSKYPRKGSHGYRDATTDTADIVETWTRTPNANVAIATGLAAGILIVDIDRRPAEGEKPAIDGRESIAQLTETLGPLPTTLVAFTPSGIHGYFVHPAVKVGRLVGFASGVDILGDGGGVIAPPSRRREGVYRWRLPAGQVEPLPRDLAELPDSWVEAFTSHKQSESRATPVGSSAGTDESNPNYVRAAVLAELRAVETAVESRNVTLNRSAFALARFVERGLVPHRDIADALMTVGLASGLKEDECRRTIASAFAARGVAA
jgi:putative DNA primase/helicase